MSGPGMTGIVALLAVSCVWMGGGVLHAFAQDAAEHPFEMHGADFVLNPSGAKMDSIHVGERTQVLAQVVNRLDTGKTFVYVASIYDEDGSLIHQDDSQYETQAGQSVTALVVWAPERAGTYRAVLHTESPYEYETGHLSTTLEIMIPVIDPKFTMSDPRVTYGSERLDAIHVGQRVSVDRSLSNDSDRPQKFWSAINIYDDKSDWVYGNKWSSTVRAGQLLTLGTPWTPEEPGTYKAILQIRHSEDGEDLAPDLELDIIVVRPGYLRMVGPHMNYLHDRVEYAHVGYTVRIAADLSNSREIDQPFMYGAVILDSDGVEVHRGDMLGSVPAGGSSSPSVAWTPESPGTYRAMVYAESPFVDSHNLASGVLDIVVAESRFHMTGARVLDGSGDAIDRVQTGTQAHIAAALTNRHYVDQSFAYSATIYDGSGTQVHHEQSAGSVPAGGSSSPSVAWTPESPGTYKATIKVWPAHGTFEDLAPPLDIAITVVGDPPPRVPPASAPEPKDPAPAPKAPDAPIITISASDKYEKGSKITAKFTIVGSDPDTEPKAPPVVRILTPAGAVVYIKQVSHSVIGHGGTFAIGDVVAGGTGITWEPGRYSILVNYDGASAEHKFDYVVPEPRPATKPPPEPTQDPSSGQIGISDTRITDSSGSRLYGVDQGDLVQLTATFKNNGDEFQAFTYVLEIEKGTKSETRHLTTQLGPGASASSGISWTPEESGTYKITASARPSVGSTVDLGVPEVFTVDVGVLIPATERMSLGRPAVDGEAKAGQKVDVTGRITNNLDRDLRHVYIVKITDESGEIVYITWAVEDVEASGEFSPSVSWVPPKPGKYEVITFVWSSLVNTPEALAEPTKSTIVVG